MSSIGPMEILLLGLVALLLFGPNKLPDIGKQLGKGIRDFKDAIEKSGMKDTLDTVNDVRSAMSPVNLGRSFVPGFSEGESGMSDIREGTKVLLPEPVLPQPTEVITSDDGVMTVADSDTVSVAEPNAPQVDSTDA